MKTFLTLTIVQLASLFCFGFIVPLDVVLKKNTEMSGNQIISIEQDVYFKDAVQELAIHESWLIEGDKNLKVTATGLGDLKDNFKFSAIYNNRTKTIIFGKNKMSEVLSLDFFERLLSVRSLSSYKTHLAELGIVPNIRLSRANGAISFAVGEPSPVGSMRPQLWFEQETFRLKKMRTPSEAEISFDDYASVSPFIQYPKTKRIEWAGKSALIKVRSVTHKTNATLSSFYPQNLEQPTEILLLNRGPVGQAIEDFYKRFR